MAELSGNNIGSSVNAPIYAFNRGIIDKLALARVDLKRSALSAEIQQNFIPHQLGPMSLRPGTRYIGATHDNAQAYLIPFVFSTDDSAIIELTPARMRVWVDDALLTRPSVTTTITNGAFTSDVSGWTDDDDVGATSQWVTGGYMGLSGNASSAAKRYQALTVAGGETGTVHAITIKVDRGHVILRIGTTAGDDDVFAASTLSQGDHSIAFTPGATTVYVQLEANTEYQSLVSSVEIEAAGAMTVTVPWTASELPTVRYSQSGNVIYCGSSDQDNPRYPRMIERRADNSWSVVRYQPEDGPFDAENASGIRVTPTATTGDITITASAPMFSASRGGGALLRIVSTQQLVTGSMSALNATTDYIEVQGVGSTRDWTLTLTGTWTATVTLERSVGTPDVWASVTTYTANTSVVVSDGLSNQIIYYRLRVSAYTSGTVDATLDYPSGSIVGVAKIRDYTSATEVSASVVVPLGGTDATRLWSWGSWNALSGHPKTPLVAEGRLWWFGQGAVWASASDAFETFDDRLEGDSRPIKRLLGQGAVDVINWAVPLQRIVAGADGAELALMSSGENVVITQDNIVPRASSTQGSDDVQAVHVDTGAVFVQRSGRRVYELAYQFEPNDYASTDLTLHATNVTRPAIVRMCVQRQPETRLHCVRSDGKVAICLFNKTEEVIAWVLFETDGVVEDAVTLPGSDEDALYYVVRRTIDGSTVRYLEKWSTVDQSQIWTTIYDDVSTATIEELEYPDGTVLTARDADGTKIQNVTASGGSVTLSAAQTHVELTPAECRCVDALLAYSGAATTTITGLAHLEGETVAVWGDGRDIGTYVVTSGQITGLSASVERAIVGLPYTGQFKSAKLAYADRRGTALAQRKKVSQFALVLQNTHHLGVQVGRDFDHLFDIDQFTDEGFTAEGHVYQARDLDMNGFAGTYDTDARLCIQAASPRPCTVAAAVIAIETFD